MARGWVVVNGLGIVEAVEFEPEGAFFQEVPEELVPEAAGEYSASFEEGSCTEIYPTALNREREAKKLLPKLDRDSSNDTRRRTVTKYDYLTGAIRPIGENKYRRH